MLSTTLLALVSAVGVVAFFWPFLAQPGSSVLGHSQDAPWLFALLLRVPPNFVPRLVLLLVRNWLTWVPQSKHLTYNVHKLCRQRVNSNKPYNNKSLAKPTKTIWISATGNAISWGTCLV